MYITSSVLIKGEKDLVLHVKKMYLTVQVFGIVLDCIGFGIIRRA